MTYLEAEYDDGYVHSERELADVSPYVPGKNVFHDIYNNLPAAEHGRLKRLSLVHDLKAYHVDWTTLPEGARPIRFIHKAAEFNTATGEQYTYVRAIEFGYQYNDENGHNVQQVVTI